MKTDKKLKYAVQYAYDGGVHNNFVSMSNVKIITDTNPIPYEEAITLFRGHLDDFKKRYKNDERPQLVIWEDVGDGEFPIYGKELLDLDYRDNLEIRGDKIYKVITKTEEIIIPE